MLPEHTTRWTWIRTQVPCSSSTASRPVPQSVVPARAPLPVGCTVSTPKKQQQSKPSFTRPKQPPPIQQRARELEVTVSNVNTSQNTKVIEQFSFPSTPLPEIPVGGRLQHFTGQWFKLSKDKRLIEMVTNCPVKLVTPPPSKQMPPVSMSSEERSAAREQIHNFLQKKAIIR